MRTGRELTRYYQTSEAYRDDLLTHGEDFLRPYIILVERHVSRPARVLDLGCGHGLSTRLLEEAGYDAFGADLSSLFLIEEKKQRPQTRLAAADAFQLPFPDRCFDAVAAFEFIEHIPDIPALLAEADRVLKPGGWMVFHSPNLISPYLPAFDCLRMALGGEGRPVFAETLPQALGWLGFNLRTSIRKRFSRRAGFVYREPDLSGSRIGGDADSVYLSNPIDLSLHLETLGYHIAQRAHAMSLKNRLAAALTPNFAPYMGLAARKPAGGE